MTRKRATSFLRLLVVAYVAALLATWAVVHGLGETFWPVSLFLFGPRWLLALPLPILAAGALVLDRIQLLALAVALLVILFPLLGLCVPWPSRDVGEPRLRLLTWNLDGRPITAERVTELASRTNAGILLFQECRGGDIGIPGWQSRRDGALCIVSQFPIVSVDARDPSDLWAMAGSGEIVRYALSTPVGVVHLTHVHLETPREGFEAILHRERDAVATLQAKNAQRDIEARLARSWARASAGGLQVIAGDFNSPVESDIYRDHWGADFQNCFSTAGFGFGWTKRTRHIGTRIDHVLAGGGLACATAEVVSWPGSSHSPLVVGLVR